MSKKYIDADNTLSSVDRAIKNYAENDDVLEFISEIRYAVIGQPAADVKKVEHGYWIQLTNMRHFLTNDSFWQCSECRHESICATDYCPFCGSSMNRKENGNNK